MFNGFPTTQTPTVQWWDYSKASTGTMNIALPNDCAPVQFFATGGSTTTIQVTLPPNPAQGKTITFKNERYVANTQSIQINDPFPQALQAPCILGQGGSVTFCYIAQNTLKGIGSANWVIISGGSGIAPLNYYAASLSGYQNNATNGYAVVVGGYQNTASGTGAAVVNGSTNSATGLYSFVIGGDNNSMARGYGGVCGGSQNSLTTSADYSVIVGGVGNTITNGSSVTIGGAFNTNSGNYGIILGGRYATTRGITGSVAATANADGLGQSVLGSNQMAFLVVAAQTTNATPTVLTTDATSAGTTNQLIMSNSSAYYFKGSIIAGVTAAGATSAWSFEGVIKRGANSAATSIVQSVINLVGQDTAASAWVFALSADTTNGGLAFTVTGAAATTIRWVCKIETTEMKY
jgi:hypothetical protein